MSDSSQSTKPSWLAKMQQKSWEPEILISGIVLFALFQIPAQIEAFVRFLNLYSFRIFSGGNVDDTLGALLLTAVYWLIFGFGSHLIFRSVWVAFLGLSYLYKDGVDFSNLKYTPKFKKAISRNTDYTQSILSLERICSGLFAVSFFLFMTVIGSVFFVLTLVLFIYGMMEFFPTVFGNESNLQNIILIPVFLYFIDFVTLGSLKRIPIFSKIYYPIYVVMSWLTLSPLYRNIYYGFVSNHKKWKVAFFVLAFALISMFMVSSIRNKSNLLNTMELGGIAGDEESLFHGYYENLYETEPSIRIQIASDIIKDNVLRVFVVHRSVYEEYAIKKMCDFDSIAALTPALNRDSLKLHCLDQFYDLELNNKPVHEKMRYTTNARTNQKGLVCFVDISHLDRGTHELKLIYNFPNSAGQIRGETMATLEFFKDVSALYHNGPDYNPNDSAMVGGYRFLEPNE